MCMLVGMLLTRTLGLLGKVGSKAVSCGKLFKVFWGKIREHTALLVLRMAARLTNSAASKTFMENAAKVLEENEDEVIQVNLVKKE